MIILSQNICQEYLETKVLVREECVSMKSLREVPLRVCWALFSEANRLDPLVLSQVKLLFPPKKPPTSRAGCQNFYTSKIPFSGLGMILNTQLQCLEAFFF